MHLNSSLCIYRVDESSSDEEMSSDYVDVEQQELVTECWIEPQYGHVVNSTAERLSIDGASYHEIASRVSKCKNFRCSVS